MLLRIWHIFARFPQFEGLGWNQHLRKQRWSMCDICVSPLMDRWSKEQQQTCSSVFLRRPSALQDLVVAGLKSYTVALSARQHLNSCCCLKLISLDVEMWRSGAAFVLLDLDISIFIPRKRHFLEYQQLLHQNLLPGRKIDHNVVARPEEVGICHTSLQPLSTGWVRQGGVGKNPQKETVGRFQETFGGCQFMTVHTPFSHFQIFLNKHFSGIKSSTYISFCVCPCYSEGVTYKLGLDVGVIRLF